MQETDGFGRLTKVLEGGASGCETRYQHDAMDRLRYVYQGGESQPGRTFTYDFLGRLTSANNESGTTAYAYVRFCREEGGHAVGNRRGLGIDRPQWEVEMTPYVYKPSDYTSPVLAYTASAGRWWNEFEPGYGPGILLIKRAGWDAMSCTDVGTTIYGTTHTHLVFAAPDGTETSLYDVRPGGELQHTCPGSGEYLRGPAFGSLDGSVVFVSGAGGIEDARTPDPGANDPATGATRYGADGTLLFRNGTQYVVTSGLVRQIIDRNGNTTSFQYKLVGDSETTAVEEITDPLGRKIQVEYNVPAATDTACGTPDLDKCDRISYGPRDPDPRQIRVIKRDLQSALRDSLGPQPIFELGGRTDQVGAVPVQAKLPNGRSYQFAYTSYGEVARIVLPTGGAIEYDHGAGLRSAGTVAGTHASGQVLDVGDTNQYDWTGSQPRPSWAPFIYRRLIERRVYPDGGSGAGSEAGKTTYSRPEIASNPVYAPGGGGVMALTITMDSYVEVVQTGANVTAPIVERHSFYTGSGGADGVYLASGGPANSLKSAAQGWAVAVPDTAEGKEYITETPGIRRVDRRFGDVSTTQITTYWNGSTNVTGEFENGDFRVCQENTTLSDTGQTRATLYFYDREYSRTATGALMSAKRSGNVTDVYEYDYGSAPALQACRSTAPGGYLRRTHTDFKTDDNYVHYTNQGVQLRALPEKVTVHDGAASVVAHSTYTYDGRNFFYPGGSSYPTSATAVTGYTPPPGTPVGQVAIKEYRGNATSVSRCLNPAASDRDTCGTWVEQQQHFDPFGNVTKTVDAKGNATTYSYADNYAGGTSLVSQSTYGFPTAVTNALGQTTSTSYSYYLGKPVLSTDSNGATTTLAYVDSMGRLTEVNFPIGKTSYEYYDSSNQVKTKRQLTTATNIETTVTYDGLGREKTGCQKDGSDSICTESNYDGAGRVRQVSNPYRGADTKQWTTTAYDAAGRVVSITRPDGSAASTTFSGNATTATDEAGKKRKSYIDGLGRLASVVEDPLGTPLTTTYSYDALDDLTGVNQSGRTRQFTYDSLKRLLTAANPESGTTTYAYDLNGNLVKKTDARSATTCYGVWSGTQCDGSGYDALNRPTRKSYSDVTPAVTYTWDTLKHGRLSSVSSSVSTTNYTAYDNMGRVTASSQMTDSTTYPFSYEYNDAGGLTKLTYPSGRVVSYTYADTGWLSAVRKAADGSGGNYAGSIAYAAHGGIRSLALGNGVTETTGYNNRLQPVSMQAGSLLTLGYAYCPNGGASCSTNNGNMLRQTVGIGSWNRTVDYTYGDAMNRLTNAAETGGNSEWSRTYGYDAYGNRWVSTWSAALPPASGTPTTSGWFDSNNRLTGVNFDTAGNQTSLLGYGFTYDAESRQKTATVNTATTQYSYDGDGRRVKTVSGGVATIYVYDAQGLLAAEYGGAGSTTGGTQYLSADHLGSTRLVTDSSAAVVKRYDYLPFGEEIPVGIGDRTSAQGYGADSFRIKFTGKERDSETGLDYFGLRYMSAAQGRFTTADPNNAGASLFDPQSWNAYSYTLNNPLKYVDPDGDVPIPVITGLVGAGVGGLVGGGAEALKQWGAGGEMKWGKVWTAAGGGALAGGLAGLTLGVGAGAGVAVTIPEAVGANAAASAIGGSAERRANEWLGYDPPNDAGTELANIGIEAATGAVGGLIGGKAADALVPIPNVQRQIRQLRFAHRRSTRAARTAAASSAAERQAFINSASGGFVGGVKSEIGEFFLRWWFLKPLREEVKSKICYTDENGKKVCQGE